MFVFFYVGSRLCIRIVIIKSQLSMFGRYVECVLSYSACVAFPFLIYQLVRPNHLFQHRSYAFDMVLCLRQLWASIANTYKETVANPFVFTSGLANNMFAAECSMFAFCGAAACGQVYNSFGSEAIAISLRVISV